MRVVIVSRDSSMRKIVVSDYTLRKLSEEKNSTLLFREKTAIASCIDGFGADAVELAELKHVKEDTIIYKTIASQVTSAAVCVPVGFSTEGVEQAWQCVKDAVKPCLQVILPVSTVTMEYTYHVKEKKMLLKIEELCKAAREKCENVEFVAQDATRADKAFLMEAIATAKNAGASAVTLCDDVGSALPSELGDLVREVKEGCGLPLYIQVSDGIRMAVASAVSALSAGADGVKAVFLGENALRTQDLCDAIAARGETIGVCTGLKVTEIHSDIRSLMKKVDRQTPSSEAAGGEKDVFLDGESTLPQVCQAVRELGYELSDEDNGKVFEALMTVCQRKSSVGAKELEAIVASSAMQAPSTYHLESYVINSGNIISSMSHVTLSKDGEQLDGLAAGDGPIDASFRAIENCVGYHYELDDFQIQAVTEGKEALGSALVRLRSNGKLYSGNGLSTDIVGASIRAYLNALNKIVFEEG